MVEVCKTVAAVGLPSNGADAALPTYHVAFAMFFEHSLIVVVNFGSLGPKL